MASSRIIDRSRESGGVGPVAGLMGEINLAVVAVEEDFVAIVIDGAPIFPVAGIRWIAEVLDTPGVSIAG